MPHTVDLPNGMRDFEFAAYMRMLVRDGVDIANTLRAHDPRTGRRWLHAWLDQWSGVAGGTGIRPLKADKVGLAAKARTRPGKAEN